jgi:hypothetical protein
MPFLTDWKRLPITNPRAAPLSATEGEFFIFQRISGILQQDYVYKVIIVMSLTFSKSQPRKLLRLQVR